MISFLCWLVKELVCYHLARSTPSPCALAALAGGGDWRTAMHVMTGGMAEVKLYKHLV